jgi:hypothetical protein
MEITEGGEGAGVEDEPAAKKEGIRVDNRPDFGGRELTGGTDGEEGGLIRTGVGILEEKLGRAGAGGARPTDEAGTLEERPREVEGR